MERSSLAVIAAPTAVITRGGDGTFVVEAANERFNNAVRLVPGADPSGRAVAGLLPRVLPLLQEAVASAGSEHRGLVLGDNDLPRTVVVHRLPGARGERFLLSIAADDRPEDGETSPELGRVALDVLERQSEMVCRWEVDGTILYCNGAYAMQWGESPARLVGRNVFEITPPDELEGLHANLARLSPSAPSAVYDNRYVAADGGEGWQEWVDRALHDDAGRRMGYLSVGRDISERKRTEARLADSEQLLRLALAAGGLGVWQSDIAAGTMRLDAICLDQQAWDLDRLELPTAEFLHLAHPEDVELARTLFAPPAEQVPVAMPHECRLRRRGGGYAWIQGHSVVAERDSEGRPTRLVGVAAEVTARKEVELQLAHAAQHDSLTGLGNRSLFWAELLRARARVLRDGGRLAVMLVDLDHFKAVNDAHGHAAGDMLLVEVARRLTGCVRARDMVARLGGDEFAILAVGGDSDDDGRSGNTAFATLAQRVVEQLSAPFCVKGLQVEAGGSVGFAVFPDDPGEPEELLAHADRALYAAKHGGRGRCSGFAPLDGTAAARPAAASPSLDHAPVDLDGR